MLRSCFLSYGLDIKSDTNKEFLLVFVNICMYLKWERYASDYGLTSKIILGVNRINWILQWRMKIIIRITQW